MRIHPGDHLDALGGERIHQRIDRALIARDDAAGEHQRIARLERQMRMRAVGHARERGARLALAAGADVKHRFRRQISRLLHRHEVRHVDEIAGLTRGIDKLVHCAPDQHGVAPILRRDMGDRLDARDIGGKRRDRNAPGLARGSARRGYRAPSLRSPIRRARTRWWNRTPWRARRRRRAW